MDFKIILTIILGSGGFGSLITLFLNKQLIKSNTKKSDAESESIAVKTVLELIGEMRRICNDYKTQLEESEKENSELKRTVTKWKIKHGELEQIIVQMEKTIKELSNE